jgi:hypothetical protein
MFTKISKLAYLQHNCYLGNNCLSLAFSFFFPLFLCVAFLWQFSVDLSFGIEMLQFLYSLVTSRMRRQGESAQSHQVSCQHIQNGEYPNAACKNEEELDIYLNM